MRYLGVFLALLTAVSTANSAVQAQSNQPACGVAEPAFCETFDQPAGTGNRSGLLNGTLWGVSRATGGVNFGQGKLSGWEPTHLQGCSGTQAVKPDNDVIICNGQLREATNDGHDVTVLAMYPKQPFDFAGRTGIVTFDVSNDTQGNHSTWPEFWITDQPVPTPFTHFSSWIAVPRNGFGLRFSQDAVPGQGVHLAPGTCPADDHPRWTADSIVVSRNYVVDDGTEAGHTTNVTPLDCVIAPTGPGSLNHVEIHVSQSQIDIYATDAGTTEPLHHLAVIQNANLTFTRGLIWIDDVHYNASKARGSTGNQTEHTFAWDNVGFDGPVIARDLTFDVLDPLTTNGDGTVNLGWIENAGEAKPLTTTSVSNIENAAAALLTFNFFDYTAPRTLTYTVNGHAHSLAWPYPGNAGFTWRTLGVPVPLNEVVPGPNTISVSADQTIVVANLDLVLVGAGGGAPPSAPAPVPPETPVPAPPPAPAMDAPPATEPMAPAMDAPVNPDPAMSTDAPAETDPAAPPDEP